jgi:hypothetical protein
MEWLTIWVQISEAYLIKRVRACTPPGEEQTQANRLEYSCDSTYSNSVERSLLGKYLADELQIEERTLVSMFIKP